VSPSERAGGSVDGSSPDAADAPDGVASTPARGDDTGGTRRRAATTDPRREAPMRRPARVEPAGRRAGANLARLRQIGLSDDVGERRPKAAPTTPPGKVIRPPLRAEVTDEIPVQRSPRAGDGNGSRSRRASRSSPGRARVGETPTNGGGTAVTDDVTAVTDDVTARAAVTATEGVAGEPVTAAVPVVVPEIKPAIPEVSPVEAPTEPAAAPAVSQAVLAELNAPPGTKLFDDEQVPDPATTTTVRRRRRPRVRKVTRVVRHVDPWSVFKVAIIFSLVLYGIVLTAGVLLWNVAQDTGTVDNAERWFEDWGWSTFEMNGGEMYHAAWVGGLFGVVGLTGFAVLLATLFNLATDLVGGIRMTVLEEEVVARDTPPLRRFVLSRRPVRAVEVSRRQPATEAVRQTQAATTAPAVERAESPGANLAPASTKPVED
jgi:hypothetical protein